MTFFTALSSHLQRTLQQSGRERRLQSGELLIRQGDCDCTLYLLQSGTLQVLTASGQGASTMS